MSSMTRTLGRSGITVSAVGLGCWAIGGPMWSGEIPIGWGRVDDSESARAILRAIDLGGTFFDTADVYGGGHSEHVLGRAVKSCRDKVVIATKFGNTFDEHGRQTTGQNADPAYIRRACEKSLRRLDTDWIDLYQFHLNGYPPEQAGEVRDTCEALVFEGKIRAYGWSTDFVEGARVFAEGPHCTAIQHQLNVLGDNAPMIALVEELNLASINRGPLAMGLLTGKYGAESRLGENDVRGINAPSWMRYFTEGKPNPEFLSKAEAVRDILTSGGRTLAQGALAWLWARSPMTVPIPGFKTVQQIEENLGAMAFGPLNAEQMGQIAAILQ